MQSDMAIEYSGQNANTTNGALQFPSLYEVGRLGTDPVNTLTQTENELYQGTGDQFGNSDTTDFTSYIDTYGPNMSVLDPNGCEIWMVGQVDIGHPTAYDGSGNQWGTVISAIHFPGCTGSTLPTSVTTSGTADASQNGTTQSGTATLTATVANTGANNSGVPDVPVNFTLGGTAVGTADHQFPTASPLSAALTPRPTPPVATPRPWAPPSGAPLPLVRAAPRERSWLAPPRPSLSAPSVERTPTAVPVPR